MDSERSMSYIINNSRGQIVAVVADGTVNTTATDLSLVGRGLTDYGTFENENYVYLLENFANSAAPLRPVLGQLWYNSATDVLAAYSSLGTWNNIATQTYVQAQKASPAFTGIPTAPTAAPGTNTNQLATTAFVTSSPQFIGTPTAPTASAGTSTTQLATTAFVTQSPQLAGTPTAPTAAPGTNTDQIATTAFVTAGPQFAGTPTAPTAASADNSTQLATTAFVQNQKISPALSGTPTAPTAVPGTNTDQIATTAFVQGEKTSPQFAGTPTAPTATTGTANTQIATTAFVRNTLLTNDVLGSMSFQNSNAVAISGGSITGITPLAVQDGGTGAANAVLARENLGLGSISVQNSVDIAITGGTIQNVAISGGTVANLTDPIPISSGGTGGNTAATARSSLELGSISTQNISNVLITGGSISGITPLALQDGGTGAGSAIAARTNLGLGSMATQNANSVGITGGSITGITTLGASGVNITSGSITGIVPLSVTDGGTGGNTAATARQGIGAAASSIEIITTGGLTGGGNLTQSRTIQIASNSNGFGTRYVSNTTPSSATGVNGDIWYQI
jgi:hypothetical protein